MNNSPFTIQFSKSQLKIFLGTLIATFVVMTLHLFGIQAPKIIAPFPQKADMFFEVISPKLEKIENSYQIQQETNFVPKAQAAGEFENAAAYAVIDFDSGEIIASKNLSQQLSIASLTKIMTSVVALDLAEPSERFTVTKYAAARIPTKISVSPGEQLTLDELLHAALMTSANDATEVIREGIDHKYGQAVFIRAMNEKALHLGMQQTSFANAQGFDDQKNFSTVEDLAIVSHYAMKNYPLLAEIAGKEYVQLPADSYHKRFDLFNWNGLIGVYPDTIGLKIGNTDDAGRTTVVLSERNGKKLLAIVLGAPGILERDIWAAQLLDFGYEQSMRLAAIDITEEQLREKYRSWQTLP